MRIISLVIFSFVLAFGNAQSGFRIIKDTDALESGIKKHSNETKSIKSDFVQEKNLSMLEEKVMSKGKFFFRKQSDIRWEYSEPFNYSIIVANGKFSINNEGKINEFDISSNAMFRQISDMIVMAVSGNFVDNQQFEIDFFENDYFFLAKLNPRDKQMASMLTSIQIFFDKSTLDVKQVKFVEPGDDFTLIKFTAYQQNIKLSDNDFRIK